MKKNPDSVAIIYEIFNLDEENSNSREALVESNLDEERVKCKKVTFKDPITDKSTSESKSMVEVSTFYPTHIIPRSLPENISSFISM